MDDNPRESSRVGPCMFWMDLEAPYAANMLEAVLVVAARVGVRLEWGVVCGGELTLVLSGDVPQTEIVNVLSLKAGRAAQAASVPL